MCSGVLPEFSQHPPSTWAIAANNDEPSASYIQCGSLEAGNSHNWCDWIRQLVESAIEYLVRQLAKGKFARIHSICLRHLLRKRRGRKIDTNRVAKASNPKVNGANMAPAASLGIAIRKKVIIPNKQREKMAPAHSNSLWCKNL